VILSRKRRTRPNPSRIPPIVVGREVIVALRAILQLRVEEPSDTEAGEPDEDEGQISKHINLHDELDLRLTRVDRRIMGGEKRAHASLLIVRRRKPRRLFTRIEFQVWRASMPSRSRVLVTATRSIPLKIENPSEPMIATQT
jgi:hypothetical protein